MSLKKVIAISSVSLASVGILAGCGSSEASNAGKYTITSLSANGTELNLQDLAKAAGSSLDEFYIELKKTEQVQSTLTVKLRTLLGIRKISQWMVKQFLIL